MFGYDTTREGVVVSERCGEVEKPLPPNSDQELDLVPGRKGARPPGAGAHARQGLPTVTVTVTVTAHGSRTTVHGLRVAQGSVPRSGSAS